MYIQSTDSRTFNGKNTYLQQARNAVMNGERAEYMKLHYTAKSRACSIKSHQTLKEMRSVPRDFSFKNFCKKLNLLFKSIKEETASIHYENKAANSYLFQIF